MKRLHAEPATGRLTAPLELYSLNARKLMVIAGFLCFGLFAARAMYADACTVPSAGQQYYYEILINIDNNNTTGGPRTVVQGNENPHPIPGVDYIVRVGGSTVIPNPPTPYVVATEVLKWDKNAIPPGFVEAGCGSGGYPIGNGQGLGGSQMVEFSVPLSVFSSPLPGTAVGVFHAGQIPVSPNDYTAAFLLAGRVTAIPALERWGLLALALLLLVAAGWLLAGRRAGALTAAFAVALLLSAGGALRALNGSFHMDGLNSDWQGISPVVTDPADDSGNAAGLNHDAAEDILYGFFATDGTNAYFRLDIRGAILHPTV